jgi:hypothetical protein
MGLIFLKIVIFIENESFHSKIYKIESGGNSIRNQKSLRFILMRPFFRSLI